ncbi:hypothetical protein EYF80_008227 [Liparis tanakae]|uniref:Uncharacterized protein n=1 Tax=Liparis tanakae TaxID=230148 RepID=A0A4Z2IU74_9TELE|nr:hypothetical protein EYF80_008227 [Liparis tanakae]
MKTLALLPPVPPEVHNNVCERSRHRLCGQTLQVASDKLKWKLNKPPATCWADLKGLLKDRYHFWSNGDTASPTPKVTQSPYCHFPSDTKREDQDRNCSSCTASRLQSRLSFP